MLQSKRDKLTVGILSKLRRKGPSRPEIPSFSPLGDGPEDIVDEADQSVAGEEYDDTGDSKAGQVKPPRRKRVPGAGGPAY